jgi:DNA-binding transcriptional LysR family regulator
MIAADLAQLEFFRVVATCKSISQAAFKLHMSQSALSRSIARLEQEVGTPLFDRQNRRVALNNYGRLFLASVDLAFYHLDSGVKSIRRLYLSDQNILTIASSTEDFLTDLLKSFAAVNPDIAFRQFRYTPQEIETHLIERDIDLAIGNTPIESPHIHYEPVSTSEFVLVYNRSMDLPGEGPVSLSQLKNVHFICDNSRMSGDFLKKIFSGMPFIPDITYEVENIELLHELLCSKAGVTIIPEPYFWRMSARFNDTDLLIRHIAESLPQSEVGVAWLKDQPLSNSSARLIDHLRKFLKGDPSGGDSSFPGKYKSA